MAAELHAAAPAAAVHERLVVTMVLDGHLLVVVDGVHLAVRLALRRGLDRLERALVLLQHRGAVDHCDVSDFRERSTCMITSKKNLSAACSGKDARRFGSMRDSVIHLMDEPPELGPMAAADGGS